MRKGFRRIIAIILCITIIINFDTSGIFGSFHREVISGKEIENDVSEPDSETAFDDSMADDVQTDPAWISDAMTDEATETIQGNTDGTVVAEDNEWMEVSKETPTSFSDVLNETEATKSTETVGSSSNSDDRDTDNTQYKDAKPETASSVVNKKNTLFYDEIIRKNAEKAIKNSSADDNQTTKTVEPGTTSAPSQQEITASQDIETNDDTNAIVQVTEYTKRYYAPVKTTVTAQMAETYTSYDDVIITVREPADWTALARITRKTDLKGVDVLLSGNSTPGVADPQTWNLTENLLKCTYTNVAGNTVTDYGLGCEDYPFAGNLTAQFTLNINSPVTLFDYLSSDAEIGNTTYKITLTYSGYNDKRRGGLANHLVLSSGEYRYKYKNLNLVGIIGHNSSANADAVGGLFGDISLKEGAENAKFVVDGKIQIPNITYVYGRIAGGIIGQVRGNINVELVSGTVVLPNYVWATGTCAGGVVGKLLEGAKLYTSGTSADNYFIMQSTNSGNLYARVRGTGYVGGLAGWVLDSTVTASYVKKCDSIRGTQYAGGLIGVAESDDVSKPVKVTIDHFILAAAYVSQESSYNDRTHGAGGVIGEYKTDLTDTQSFLKISNVTSESASRESSDNTRNHPEIGAYNGTGNRQLRYSGGVIANIYGNNVEIWDIDFTVDKYKINQIWNCSGDNALTGPWAEATKIAGTVVGGAIGQNIHIHDIVVASEKVTTTGDASQDTGISAWITGGVIGEAGYYNDANTPGTKIKLKNIEIRSIHTWSGDAYFGGIAGRVGAGTVMSLEGNIDLSGLTKNPKSSATMTSAYTSYADLPGTVDDVSAAGNQNTRGFVVGYAQESLIYFEPDAVVTRPIVVEDGVVYYGADTSTTVNSNNRSYANYCIDDIGNYGSVYRNIVEDGASVIVFANEYGNEVTGTVGTVEQDGKTYYRIDSQGDALRLAIAGNTYDYWVAASRTLVPRFAAKCFKAEGDITIEELLASNYLISTDLDLESLGIHGFLRNDTGRTRAYGFSGIMKGASKGDGTRYKIMMNFISKQHYGGLFPYLMSGATFRDIDFDGYVCYTKADYNSSGRGAMGTIAAESIGNLTIENVDVSTRMRSWYADVGTWDNARMYSYGGYVGYVNLWDSSDRTITVSGCHISPYIYGVQAISFGGGLFGMIRTNTGSAISVKSSVISTEYVADSNFTYNYNGDNHHARYGGLIGFIGDAYYSVTSTNGNVALPGYMRETTYSTLTIDDCDIVDSKLDLQNAPSTAMRVCGGFLGYAWLNVEATFNDIEIKGECEIYGRGLVGGLVSWISGKCDVKNIKVTGLHMKSMYNNQVYSSFLFGNTQYAYIVFDQASYKINTAMNSDGVANVRIENYSNFDEIAGWSLAGVDGSFSGGGIINIINDKFKSFKQEDYAEGGIYEGQTYGSYLNQLITMTNKYSRYHYNLFTGEEADWKITVSGSAATIDSPKKMLTWQAGFNTASAIKRFFAKYYINASGNVVSNYYNINTFNIVEDIDLNGYSYYPIYLSGKTVNGLKADASYAKITLYGKEVSVMEDGLYDSGAGVSKIDRDNQIKSNNAAYDSQHYLMHASIFYSVTGGTIKNLKLEGNAAYNLTNSAFLCGGNMTGTVTVQNIILAGAVINDYANQAGLLIARIGDSGGSYVTIDGIETDYSTPMTTPAASALIRKVGNDSATDVRVIFKNMRVHSAAKSTDNVSDADKVFEWASFIYEYDYTNSIEDNRCYVLYTFDYDDTVKEVETAGGEVTYELNKNVTYGQEIGGKANKQTTVEYNDTTRDEVGKVPGKNNPLNVAIGNARKNYYIPYIYAGRYLFINPLNGNLNEGCGTYEDPYIIKNNRQFIALYSYLTYKTEKYASMLSGWQVNKVGGDGDAHECSVKKSETAPHELMTYGDTDFPARDELRTAYYQVTVDIDLDAMTDWNDNLLVSEFNGLGTLEKPFAGVIVGKKTGVGGTCPAITLPRQGAGNEFQENYGLIQYMQGAVVKDLMINTPAKKETDLSEVFINVTSLAGGVAAKIVGGDNIIDNVSVGVRISAYNTSDVASSTVHIGGYVGMMEKGSLIIRNINGDKAVAASEFRHQKSNDKTKINYYKTNDTDGAVAELTSNQVGLLVGEVYDGFVLYEHNDTERAFEDTSKKVLSKTDLVVCDNAKNALKLVNRFDLINGYAIDKAVEQDGKIKITTVNTDDEEKGIKAGSLKVEIQNGEELEVMALALNSDELSIHYNESEGKGIDTTYTHHTMYTYDYTARCRKADYSGLGSLGTDRDIAQLCDDGNASDKSNVYLYPYLLYKYADFVADGNSHTYTENYQAYKTKTFVDNISEETDSKYYSSKFNKIDSHVYDYTTTYELASSATGVFDVSGYGISFRGFGELYREQVSDFRANFNGNGKNVKIYMDRSFDNAKDFSTGMFNKLKYDARYQGTLDTNVTDSSVLLSSYPDRNAASLVIENINIVDSTFINHDANETDSDSTTPKRSFTGAIAGQVEGVWDFSNIKVKSVNESSVIKGDKYVGGIIGSVNSTKWYYYRWDYNDDFHLASNVIHFNNCGIEGKADKKVTIESISTVAGVGQAIGGLVGGVGHYRRVYNTDRAYYFGTVDFKDCSVKYCDIATDAEGCTGGFAGYVGFRRHDYIHYASGLGRVTVENSNENSTLKNIDSVTLSNNITVNVVTNREFNSSMGGIFGKVQSANKDNKSRDNAAMIIDGVNISNLTIQPSKTTEGIAYYATEPNWSTGYNMNAVGGVIGMAKVMNLDLKNINITSSTIGTDHNCMDVGGLVGYIPRMYAVNFNNRVQINAEKIKIDNTQIISNTGRAGGLFGRMISEHNVISDVEMNKCAIQSNMLDVGGIVAYLKPYRGAGSLNQTSEVLTSISDVKVEKTSIKTLDNSSSSSTTVSAGGIIGYAVEAEDGDRFHSMVLENIYVGSKCDIRGDKAAGGIIGSLTYLNASYAARLGLYLNGYIGVGAKAAYDSENGTYTWTEDITTGNLTNTADYNNIAGRLAGGFTGCDDTTSARSIAAEVYIANNRIYSYDRAENQAKSASGGIAGYKRGDTGVIIYDSITVMHNLIVTSGRGKGAHTSYTTNLPAAGGIYGRLENSGGRTHMPNVVMKDNSIGFYDLSGNSDDGRYEAFKSLSLTSKEIKLFYYNTDISKVEAVNWQELSAPITEDNIRQYSLGIGNFIGYLNSSRQVSIMKPDVTYDTTIGSIPAIDVANASFTNSASRSEYGTGYPYGYRSNIHIFYIRNGSAEGKTKLDSSITTGGEDEYLFYDMDTIISDYKAIVAKGKAAATPEEIKQATYDFMKSDKLNMYMTYTNGSESTRYNLFSISNDGTDTNYYNSTYKKADGTYIMTSSTSSLNGVSALVLDGHSAQHLGDFADFILTGGSGTGNASTLASMYNSNNADSFLYVSCVNAVITPEGLIKKNNNEYGTGDNKTKTSINSNNHYQLTMEQSNGQSCPYDEFIAEEGVGTYYTVTLVEYTYKCRMTSGVVKTETIYIPIYVKEKVTMRSNVRVIGDEDYSYSDAKTDGKSGSIVIAHGSIYTIFAEFAYDEIRLKPSFAETRTDKTLIFDNNLQGLPKDTKLTLVDSQTGKAYYYVIEADSDAADRVNKIKFTDFKDADGNTYTEKCIGNGDISFVENNHRMIDNNILNGSCAIERFYIFVEPPEGSLNITFRLSVDAQTKNQANNSMNEYFKLYPDAVIPMTFIPGTQISLSGVSKTVTNTLGTKDVTEIMGRSGETEIEALYISQDRSIEVDATVDISLVDSTSPYWTNKENTIDSTNNGKYIDVAVSLLDENNREVSWPEGTNIVFNNGLPRTVNGSTVYLYKDSDCYNNSAARFMYNTLDRDLDGNIKWYYATFHDDLSNSYISRWVTKDDDGWFYYMNQTEKNYDISELEISELSNHVHLSFDFSVADIDDYAGNKYKIRLKLYRTSDPGYPIEEEIEENTEYERYTEYVKEAWGQSDKDMGTAVSVDDLMELGINVYQNTNQKEVINFKNKFDFTNVINSKNADKAKADRDKAAESAYMVTYRLQKKNMSGVYETIDWNNSPFKLYDKVIVDDDITNRELEHITIDEKDVYVEHKKFTSEEILTGTDGIKYVTQWDLQLEADIPSLSEDKGLWTNYKVVATYLPYDDGVDSNELDIKAPPTTDATAILTDFYIFTVAKLKTDL